MKTEDPQIYFKKNNIEESLVLRFIREQVSNTVTIVFDIADFVLSQDKERFKENRLRKFSKLVFIDVTEFKRKNSSLIYSKTEEYYAQKDEGALAIYAIQLNKGNRSYTMNFSLGSFGDISFSFGGLLFENRICRAILSANGEWEYFDLNGDKLVNFFNPFGD